jgi:hypothetical protein
LRESRSGAEQEREQRYRPKPKSFIVPLYLHHNRQSNPEPAPD